MADASKKSANRASSGIGAVQRKAAKAIKAKKTAAKERPAAPRKRSRAHHHHVYVIELARSVMLEPRFKRANPDYDPTKPCVYVGMTGLSPDVRFDKHKAGIQSNSYAQNFGLHLLPALYECYNPMPYEGALDMEVELAIALREQGYGVWQA